MANIGYPVLGEDVYDEQYLFPPGRGEQTRISGYHLNGTLIISVKQTNPLSEYLIGQGGRFFGR